MGYANHIGRVGALAVALGIGAAVATQPGIGWAQDGGSSADSGGGSSSASDSGGSQQQSDQSQSGQSQSQDSSSSSPSSDPTPSSPSAEPSGSSTTISGGSSPDVTISSSGGALTSGGAPSSSGDADPASGGAGDVIESSGTGAGQQGTPPAGGESAPVQTTTPAGMSGESTSSAGSHNDIHTAAQEGNTGGSTNPQQGDDSGNSIHSLSEAASNTNNQDQNQSGQSFRTVSTFSAMSTLDAPAASPAVAPAQDPISALLAIPAAFINAAANIVINFFEPFVAPGGPFENAALFALLEVTRRQFGQSFANSTPNIGPDISLTVDENSAGKSLGTLPAADVDGDTITYTVDPTDGPEHGTVTIVGNVVTYKPTTGYTGADGFTLVGNDGGGHIYAPGQGPTDTATVSITVEATGPNTAPVANDDTYSLDVGQTITVSALAGVLANDTDADAGDTLTAVKVTDPTKGTLTFNADGSFSYTATSPGTDSFTYKANDGRADSNTATVTITNTAVPTNTAPVATADTYSATVGTPLTVTAANGVLHNDTDADAGDTLTAVKVTDPGKGGVTLNADGSFTYTANAGATGTDTFTYKANDGQADSNTATVTITLNPVTPPANTAPVATADTYSATVGTPLTVTAANGVLHNDTDADAGDTLTAVKVTDPSKGGVTLNADGSFTYTANAGATGTDTFTYEANDGQADSNTATVTITLNPAQTGQAPSVLGTSNLPGVALSTVVDGPNGVTYQTITKNYSTTSATTSVYAIDPDHPGNPVAIVTDAAGEQRGGLVFGPNGTAYQTTFVYAQPGVNQQQVHVIVINLNSPSATPPVVTINNAENALFDPAIAVGSDGKAYQLSTTSTGSGTTLHLTVIDPAQPLSATTADFAGATDGYVSVAGGKTLLTYQTPNGADYTTTVVSINSANPQSPTQVLQVNGQILPTSTPFVSSDGRVFVTTFSSTDGTHIRVIKPSDLANPGHLDVAGGTPLAGSVEGLGGVVYIPVNTSAITGSTPADFAVTETAKVYAFGAGQTGSTGEIDVPGLVIRTPAVGTAGRLYFATQVDTFTTSGVSTAYFVSMVDPAHPAMVVSVPIAKPGQSTGLAVGSDGKAYLTTETSSNGSTYTTHLVVVDPQSATPQVIDVNGDHTADLGADVTIGPDGLVYLTTLTYPATTGDNTTHVSVIDPHTAGNPIIKTLDIAGSPIGNVVFDSDGIGYQTTSGTAGTRVAVIGVPQM